MSSEQLAAFLKRERERLRLSQPRLAELSGVGRDYISSIERARITVIYPETANRLKDALGVAGWRLLAEMGYETDVSPEATGTSGELAFRVGKLNAERQAALLGLLDAFEQR